MDSLNIVALTGLLEGHPVMRVDTSSSTPRCSGTLRCEEVNSTGSIFRLYVPLDAWGKSAEALGELHAGTWVAVQGKLCWRKQQGKGGKDQSALAVLVGKVSVLVHANGEAQLARKGAPEETP